MTVGHGLGGGRLPHKSTNKRQWDIANVIPVTEASFMTSQHWKELFQLEHQDLPRDYYVDPARGSTTVFGVKQPNVTRQHRHRIVNWMSEACALFRWTSESFFTSVHAWDAYMTHVSHVVSPSELPKLSAACLYFGAELLESAADDCVKTLAEFTDMCPEAGSVEDLRETQAHLVDTLQGMSLARRTPLDFILLYLAQLQLVPSPGPELFQALLDNELLDVVWDLSLNLSLVIYSNGLILDGLPASRWVAAVLLRVLEFVTPELRKQSAYQRSFIMKTVFHAEDVEEPFYLSIVDQILQRVWQRTSMKDAAEIRSPSNESSYAIIKHRIPQNFAQWSITDPSNKVVQRVSLFLRNSKLFYGCSPPSATLNSWDNESKTNNEKAVNAPHIKKKHSLNLSI